MSDLERLRYAALRLTVSHPTLADDLKREADRVEYFLDLARVYVPDLSRRHSPKEET